MVSAAFKFEPSLGFGREVGVEEFYLVNFFRSAGSRLRSSGRKTKGIVETIALT